MDLQRARSRKRPVPAAGASPRSARRRPAALVATAALLTAALVAAGCGSSEPSMSAAEAAAVAAMETLSESRPGQGIEAAGGAIMDGTACAEERYTIAVVAPDVLSLGDLGLGSLVFDPPDRVMDGYLNNLNRLGGLNGACFDLASYVWGFTDTAGDVERFCGDLVARQPVALFAFATPPEIVECATILLGIPTLALYSQAPGPLQERSGGRLLLDYGSTRYLLENTLLATSRAGLIAAGDTVALLYEASEYAQPELDAFGALAERLRFAPVTVGVPLELGSNAVRVLENQLAPSGFDLLRNDQATFEAALAALPPDFGALLSAARDFHLATAVQLEAAGVTAVAVSANWLATIHLMTAAETIGWRPRWLITDAQHVMAVLTGVPAEQGRNLYQISSRRAADDPIGGLDRGCLSVRNTDATGVAAFEHRHHTDAWSAMTETCDYLDVLFAAITRVNGPLTPESLATALAGVAYEAPHGSLIRFAADDFFGSDSFRIVAPDLDCVLNEWGCMRADGDWFPAVRSTMQAVAPRS